MTKRFTVLLGVVFLAAMAAPCAQTDAAGKGKGKETIVAGKKGGKDKLAPPEKDQKGGKKGTDKTNTQTQTKTK